MFCGGHFSNRKRTECADGKLACPGGASILITYGFGDTAYDVGVLIQTTCSMKDAINYATDPMGLPNDWLNDDFRRPLIHNGLAPSGQAVFFRIQGPAKHWSQKYETPPDDTKGAVWR